MSALQGDVVRQTEEAIRRTMDQLKASRPLVWEALELKKRLALWQSQTASLNVLQLVSATNYSHRRVCISGSICQEPARFCFVVRWQGGAHQTRGKRRSHLLALLRALDSADVLLTSTGMTNDRRRTAAVAIATAATAAAAAAAPAGGDACCFSALSCSP